MKVFMDNTSLKYFETQLKAMTKQWHWCNTLALIDVELIHKLGWDNAILDALSCKEEYNEKP
jgi:hypothetical protein